MCKISHRRTKRSRSEHRGNPRGKKRQRKRARNDHSLVRREEASRLAVQKQKRKGKRDGYK